MKYALSTLIILSLFFTTPLYADIIGEEIEYQASAEDVTLKGYLAYDSNITEPRPAVLVVHEWWGHNEYARKRAHMLAELGYTALAVDMYGDGKHADHPKEAAQFMRETIADMDVAMSRFLKAMEVVKQQDHVNPEHIAAIGYCFGGGIVLAAARAGFDLDGVASFHGSLGTETPAKAGDIKAQVAVFTGGDDPMVPPEQVQNFKNEMEQAEVIYQLTSYPGVVHSFTTPDADKFGKEFDLPLAYDVEADQKSWAALQTFLQDIFTEESTPAAK